jgi:Flp pilus assembly protein TadB
VADAITIVIGSAFGGFLLLVILGFYLIQHRNRNTSGPSGAYESRDYYAQYGPKRSDQSKYSYQGSRRPFRTDAEIEENARRVRTNARAIMLVVLILAIIAIIVSSLYNLLYSILLIFLIPIAFSFFRSRQSKDRNRDQDSESRRR